jgi:hypothetical protein
MDSPERSLGNVATRLLLENERVRIWEMDLAPGERSATHRHDLDYVLVQIKGDRVSGISNPIAAGPIATTSKRRSSRGRRATLRAVASRPRSTSAAIATARY